MQHPSWVIAGVHKPAIRIGKMNASGEESGHSCFRSQGPSLILSAVDPKLEAREDWIGMIPKECKRLAELDFPMPADKYYSASTAREGQPTIVHLWLLRISVLQN